MQHSSLDQRFADAMGQMLGPNFPTDLGLAVSGGGDSMAMLALAHHWARVWGVRLWVVTIDHGLRPESASEAAMVADEARLLGHKHCTLKWSWDGQGNVQARAREARLELIDRWRGLLEHVLFAHTADDVAETFLIRLSRRAGVEGLSEMARSRVIDLPGPIAALRSDEFAGDIPPQDRAFKGTRVRPGRYTLHRPCLDMSRDDLRHYARTLHVRWVDDPSNDDSRFDRVKVRKVIPTLEEAGLSRDALVSAARHMARAAETLRLRAADAFKAIGDEGRVAGMGTGELLFDRTGFEDTDRDTQLRLLSYALSYISGQSYRPREAPLDTLLDRLLAGGKGTLHGCEAHMERDQLRLFREFKAVQDHRLTLGPKDGSHALWDGRWNLMAHRLSSDEHRAAVIRALGEDGWAQVNTPPEGAPPYASARSLPSVWLGDQLIMCDIMGVGEGRSELWPMGKEMYGFRQFLLSH